MSNKFLDIEKQLVRRLAGIHGLDPDIDNPEDLQFLIDDVSFILQQPEVQLLDPDQSLPYARNDFEHQDSQAYNKMLNDNWAKIIPK